MGSLSSTMAISTPLLLLLLPVLALTLQQRDIPDQPRPGAGALQWDQSKHGGPQGSETWFMAPDSDWPHHHLQSKRYWQALVGSDLFPNRFGKITKREMLEKKDQDGRLAAKKMRPAQRIREEDNDENMREREEEENMGREEEQEENMGEREEEQRIVETIRILQDFLLRGRKYSRFA